MMQLRHGHLLRHAVTVVPLAVLRVRNEADEAVLPRRKVHLDVRLPPGMMPLTPPCRVRGGLPTIFSPHLAKSIGSFPVSSFTMTSSCSCGPAFSTRIVCRPAVMGFDSQNRSPSASSPRRPPARPRWRRRRQSPSRGGSSPWPRADAVRPGNEAEHGVVAGLERHRSGGRVPDLRGIGTTLHRDPLGGWAAGLDRRREVSEGLASPNLTAGHGGSRAPGSPGGRW